MPEKEKATATEEVGEASETVKETEESSDENTDPTYVKEAEVVEGRFGKAPDDIPATIQKAPEEPQKHYQSIATKGATLQEAHAEIIDVNSKEELKENLPKAIVIKRNFKKDVDQLFNSFKEYRKMSENPEDVQEFKEACNLVIREAQKAHGAIKNKIISIYEKN